MHSLVKLMLSFFRKKHHMRSFNQELNSSYSREI